MTAITFSRIDPLNILSFYNAFSMVQIYFIHADILQKTCEYPFKSSAWVIMGLPG